MTDAVCNMTKSDFEHLKLLKSKTEGGMLRMFSASQVGRYSINRHVAGSMGGVSRHGSAVSSSSITMVNPLREA